MTPSPIRSKKQQNLGLCILRMLMCFEVVLCHFWHSTSVSPLLLPFYILRNYAVPVFMLMSFFLTQASILSKKSQVYKNRLLRLLIPQFGWAIIYWLIYQLISIIVDINLTNGPSDIFWQILTGHCPCINPAMWYQTVLITQTIIFILLFNYFPKRIAFTSTYVLMIAALFLQYSGLNYYMFSQLRYELQYPLGRFFEMLPYATIGGSFSYYKLYSKHQNYRIPILVISCFAVVLLLSCSLLPSAPGFGYSGVQAIIIAILLLSIAFLLPLDNVSKKIRKCIEVFTKYTLGIYCMHNLLGRIFFAFLKKFGIVTDTFFQCCLIYFLCYFASSIIYKLPLKVCKQLVS